MWCHIVDHSYFIPIEIRENIFGHYLVFYFQFANNRGTVIMKNAVMLSVIVLNVIMRIVIMINIIMLDVIMLNVIMLNVIKLNVTMLSRYA